MQIDLVDLHAKSSERITANWGTSVLINALTVGWVIAVYAVMFKLQNAQTIPILLQSALTLFHFPAYCMSCYSLVREYNLFHSLNDSLVIASKSLPTEEQNILQLVTARTVALRPPYSSRYVIEIHVLYAILLYSIIWFPRLFLPS